MNTELIEINDSLAYFKRKYTEGKVMRATSIDEKLEYLTSGGDIEYEHYYNNNAEKKRINRLSNNESYYSNNSNNTGLFNMYYYNNNAEAKKKNRLKNKELYKSYYNNNYNYPNMFTIETKRINRLKNEESYFNSNSNNSQLFNMFDEEPDKYRLLFNKYTEENKKKGILNKVTNFFGSFIQKKNNTSGGSKFIYLKGIGKRKLRFQKNGRPYVIVNKKKVKI